jgi:hypothetical protein
MLPSRARTESPSCEKACQRHEAQPAEHPLQQPDPEEATKAIAQCIEGEDHGTLDVDHVPIEYAPSLHILPITANREASNQAMPWNSRIAQTEQQSHQGGEQDDRRPDPGIVAVRGKADGMIHG